MTTVLGAGILACPAASAGTATPYVIDLAHVRDYYGLKGDQIIGAQAVSLTGIEPRHKWDQGVYGLDALFKSGALGIDATGGPMTVPAGLLLQAGLPGLQALRVMSCRAGDCRALAVEAAGGPGATRTSVTLGAAHLAIAVNGDLCAAGGECAVMLPSWAIAKLLASGDGSLAAFPKVATLVQIPGHLLLIDAATGHTWLRWEVPNDGLIAGFGALRSATLTASGALVANFAAGGLTLDFAQDLALASDTAGALYLGQEGLGSGELASFQGVFDPQELPARAAADADADQSAPRLLVLGDGAAVSSRGAVAFALTVRHGFKELAATAASGLWVQATWLPQAAVVDPAYVVLKQDGGGNFATAYLDQTHGLAERPLATYPSFADQTTDARLLGEDLFGFRSDAVVAPPQAGKAPAMVLARSPVGEATSAPSGELLEAHINDGTADKRSAGCTWVRVAVLHDGSTKERGPSLAPCAARSSLNMANGAGVMAAVARTPDRIFMQLWWPDAAD